MLLTLNLWPLVPIPLSVRLCPDTDRLESKFDERKEEWLYVSHIAEHENSVQKLL